MKIYSSNINFTAKFIKPITVQKKTNNNYSELEVSLFEFEPEKEKDLDILNRIASTWKKAYYVHNIYDDILDDYKYHSKNHFFFITDLKDSLEDIKPHNILGIAEFEEEYFGSNFLHYLQTNPLFMKKFENLPEYKHIGTSFLEHFKEMSKGYILKLCATNSSKEFYEKKGLKGEVCTKHGQTFSWTSED